MSAKPLSVRSRAALDADKAALDAITGVDGPPLSAWINDDAGAGTKLGDGLSSDLATASHVVINITSAATLRGNVLGPSARDASRVMRALIRQRGVATEFRRRRS